MRPGLKNNQRKKVGGMAQVVESFLASAKPWVQPPVPPKKKKNLGYKFAWLQEAGENDRRDILQVTTGL
jgi:hypothetical protein